MKLSNAHSRLFDSLASGFVAVGPAARAFTQLGREDVKVDILISRLTRLHVQQFAFELTNFHTDFISIPFHLQVTSFFLCNQTQRLTAGVKLQMPTDSVSLQGCYRPHMLCLLFPSVRRGDIILCISALWASISLCKQRMVWRQVKKTQKSKGASALMREALTVMDCS